MKAFDIDILEIKKKKIFYKKILTAAIVIEIILILTGGILYLKMHSSYNAKKAFYSSLKNSIKQENNLYKAGVKKAIALKYKLKKEIDFLNQRIEAKALDYKKIISTIKNSTAGTIIVSFSLKSIEKTINLKLSSTSYKNLLECKKMLEKNFVVELLSDTKESGNYIVSFSLKAKNE